MNLLIDPRAEPIGHRPPYKPIDVSGRKVVVQEVPALPLSIGCDFGRTPSTSAMVCLRGYHAVLRHRFPAMKFSDLIDIWNSSRQGSERADALGLRERFFRIYAGKEPT